jgi:hypothetical protein
MTEDPRWIGRSASVVEASRLMRESHIGSLPIPDGELLDLLDQTAATDQLLTP